jgi:hypothetical protein
VRLLVSAHTLPRRVPQYGFCCVYVVFISQNTANFIPDYGWYEPYEHNV